MKAYLITILLLLSICQNEGRILTLTDANYEPIIHQHGIVLIQFYVTPCEQCIKYNAIFQEASILGEAHNYTFAEVNS